MKIDWTTVWSVIVAMIILAVVGGILVAITRKG